VSTSISDKFPNWIPPAIIHAAEQLHAELMSERNPTEALAVWSRLVFDSRMKRVWQELYKKNRLNHQATEEFFYPACVTHKSFAAKNRRVALEIRQKGSPENEKDANLLEAEAAVLESINDPHADSKWSEQDRAVQLFFYHAYKEALDHKLVFLSDLEAKSSDLEAKSRKVQEVAERLRCEAATLSSLGMKRAARKLREIASDCDYEALNILPARESDGSLADDPWIIARRRGNLAVRTFVTSFSIPVSQIFGTNLYSTLATVTNVVFNDKDLTGGKVRDMLRI
jgi:hypothetical protein